MWKNIVFHLHLIPKLGRTLSFIFVLFRNVEALCISFTSNSGIWKHILLRSLLIPESGNTLASFLSHSGMWKHFLFHFNIIQEFESIFYFISISLRNVGAHYNSFTFHSGMFEHCMNVCLTSELRRKLSQHLFGDSIHDNFSLIFLNTSPTPIGRRPGFCREGRAKNDAISGTSDVAMSLISLVHIDLIRIYNIRKSFWHSPLSIRLCSSPFACFDNRKGLFVTFSTLRTFTLSNSVKNFHEFQIRFYIFVFSRIAASSLWYFKELKGKQKRRCFNYFQSLFIISLNTKKTTEFLLKINMFIHEHFH